MIDRRTLLASAAAAWATSGAARGEVSPLDYSWQLIAQSRFIVIGVTRPPEGSYPGQGDAPWIEVPVTDIQALKGTPPAPLILNQMNFAPGILNTIMPWEFAGQRALLFIGDQTGDPPRVMLTHMEAMLPAEPKVVEAVTREVAAQAAYLAAWKPDVRGPHYGQVKEIVDWLAALSPRDPDVAARQAAGFIELEALGEGAASAIVAQMDDRRPLAVARLSLGATRTGARERSHQPTLMIDALAAMLEQITGQRFGAPYDDGRESQRRLALDGWRLYVGRHTRGL